MREFALASRAAVVMSLLMVVSSCSGPITDDPVTKTTWTTTTPGNLTVETPSTEAPTVPSLTFPPQVDPHYYTFESTLECEPDATDADLQVVQAFFTAYNERDLERLQHLVSPDLNEIWDPSGIPHTGSAHNPDVATWAQAGWEVNDRFQLVLLVSYGPFAGSDIILARQNDVLMADGIEELVVGFKVPSSGCTIDRLVGHVDTRVLANCRFYDLYSDELRRELSSDWQIPSLCT